DTFRQLATRAPGRVRDVSERIRQRLERGDSLEDALQNEEKVLPPLFRAMARVGEHTGHLPEIFTKLERYYLQQQKLRRDFRARTLPTLVQLVFAFLIITAVLFILSALPGGGLSVLGARGTGAGVVFLLLSFGSLALVFVAYLLIKRAARQNERL